MLPNKPLTDKDLIRYAKKLKLPYFKGVFMRDTLPRIPPNKNESAIINLDVQRNAGTHWVAYKKRGNIVEYFDSFGALKPPIELVEYLGRNVKIVYNNSSYQKFNEINCGHLCLEFLYHKKI